MLPKLQWRSQSARSCAVERPAGGKRVETRDEEKRFEPVNVEQREEVSLLDFEFSLGHPGFP